MIHKELKKAILIWLLDNENEWQRVNACHKYFRQYIYDNTGNYIMGGKDVSDFIIKADKLLFEGVK